MHTKKNFHPRTRLTQTLGLPYESFGTVAQVLLLGKERLRARPCQRLLQYDTQQIKAQIAGQVLCICGKELAVCMFCAEELELCGTIEQVFWEGRV